MSMTMEYGLNVDDDDDRPMAVINTTPLVDVMLVLLIIFLITIPVVIHSVPISLPKEIATPTINDLNSTVIGIDQSGKLFWNDEALSEDTDLSAHLKAIAETTPQAVIRIRGDQEAKFEIIANILRLCGEAGLAKVNFITEPPHE